MLKIPNNSVVNKLVLTYNYLYNGSYMLCCSLQAYIGHCMRANAGEFEFHAATELWGPVRGGRIQIKCMQFNCGYIYNYKPKLRPRLLDDLVISG